MEKEIEKTSRMLIMRWNMAVEKLEILELTSDTIFKAFMMVRPEKG